MNSRNLVSRPAGAKPAWPGVSPPEPVVSLATGAVTRPAKRRHTSAWAVGNAATKSMTYRVPRVLFYSKATTSRPNWARAAWNPAGCTTTARATWGRPRNLGGPGFSLEESGGRETRLSLSSAWCVRGMQAPAANKKHPRQGRPKAREDHSRGRGKRGSRWTE